MAALPTDEPMPSTVSELPATQAPPLVAINGGAGTAKDWRTHLLRKGSQIRKTLKNAMVPLQHAAEFHGALRYNASALTVVVDRKLPWDKADKTYPRVWEDNDDRHYTVWLEDRGIDLRMTVIYDAVQAVARETPFHPIREYLEKLTWDGKPRIGRWLTTYLGADDTPLNGAMGLRWLVSAVARIMRPGCKADCMLVLEGEQGLLKSTALKILATEDWFTDEMSEPGSRDCAMSIAGKWIIEVAELDAFKGTGLEKIKAFLSRSVDRFRPPWGRGVVDSRRQCVFAGTTNETEIFSDSTGNRRFWPVTCHKTVDVEKLQQDRGQLWAEAKVLFEQGQVWWLDTQELRDLAAVAADERFNADPWEEQVAAYVQGKREITTAELLEEIAEVETAASTKALQMRMGKILTHLRWEKRERMLPTRVKQRFYVAPGVK